MFVEAFGGGAGAEAGHADEDAVLADEPVPALADAGLDGRADGSVADDGAAVGFRLSFEQLERGDRDHAGGDAGRLEDRAGPQREIDLRA